MAVLERRVQVLFDPAQYDALARLATDEGKPVGAVIRESVADKLASGHSARQTALDALFQLWDATPGPAEDWDSIKASLEQDRPYLWSIK